MRRWLLSFALVAVPAAALAAQAPDDRARLETYRGALAAVADSVELLARERDGIARARQDRDNPLVHLELGFLALRLGEVTANRAHYDDAAGEFEWAAELRPEWPYPWYGLGLAELANGEHGGIAIENIRQALGKDFLSKAAGAFARAADADPSFVRAVVDLAETARRQRVRPRLEVAQRALRAAAASTAGATPAVQLARGRVERDVGEGDSALAAFDAYLARGGDASLGQLERARTLFFLRRPGEGRAAYYAGAAAASDSARAGYRSDLGWIATPDELTAFDALAPGALAAWLRTFWGNRDAEEGRSAGERLPEHYRRLTYAFRQFRLVSRHRTYTVEPYRSAQTELDDRGVVYLRQGEPDDRARYVAPNVDPNESWVYRRAGEDLIYHFVARGGVQDYKLVESLADVLGFNDAIAWQAAGRLPPTAAALYDSRARLDQAYRTVANSPTAQGTFLAGERRRGHDAIREGTGTDRFPLRFADQLASRLQVYAVGGADGEASLLVVFAVPGGRLTPRGGDAGAVYPLRIRLTDQVAGAAPAFLDTTRLFATAAPLAADQYLTGYLEVPVAPGVHTLRAVLADAAGAAGDVVDVDSAVVPAFDADGLVLSDLVLGDAGAGLAWRAGRDTVPLSPLGTYPAGGSLELYYELHGLAPGAPYRAEVQVRGRRGGSVFARIGRLFGGGGPAVSFAFDAVATGRPTRGRQTVNLAPLSPGDYTLTLTVTRPDSDIRHTRDVRFHVTGR